MLFRLAQTLLCEGRAKSRQVPLPPEAVLLLLSLPLLLEVLIVDGHCELPAGMTSVPDGAFWYWDGPCKGCKALKSLNVVIWRLVRSAASGAASAPAADAEAT